MPQPRKPIALLKLEGTYREDRHGARAAAPQPAGELIRPKGLNGTARKLWDDVVPTLIELGIATPLDAAALGIMCEQYSFYCAAKSKLAVDPLNSRARNAADLYLRAFERLAGQFGLTSLHRSKIQAPTPPKAAAGSGSFARDRAADGGGVS